MTSFRPELFVSPADACQVVREHAEAHGCRLVRTAGAD